MGDYIPSLPIADPITKKKERQASAVSSNVSSKLSRAGSASSLPSVAAASQEIEITSDSNDSAQSSQAGEHVAIPAAAAGPADCEFPNLFAKYQDFGSSSSDVEILSGPQQNPESTSDKDAKMSTGPGDQDGDDESDASVKSTKLKFAKRGEQKSKMMLNRQLAQASAKRAKAEKTAEAKAKAKAKAEAKAEAKAKAAAAAKANGFEPPAGPPKIQKATWIIQRPYAPKNRGWVVQIRCPGKPLDGMKKNPIVSLKDHTSWASAEKAAWEIVERWNNLYVPDYKGTEFLSKMEGKEAWPF